MTAILDRIAGYMAECEEVGGSFEGHPGKVEADAEQLIQKIGGKVAALHFSDIASATDTSPHFEQLKEIKTRFIEHSPTKIPKSILCALLRSLVSRDISVSTEELGIADHA